MTKKSALHRLRAHAIAVECVRPELNLLEAVEEVATEIDQLRAIFPRVLAGLKSASGCLPDASLEFLEWIPAEVEASVSALHARIKVLEERLAEHERRPDVCAAASELPARCMACARYAVHCGADWCHSETGSPRRALDDIAVTEGPPPAHCPLRGSRA